MAVQTIDIKMSRFENSPWGFRLHGGSDFGTPFSIQKVNPQSLSEAAGLRVGDIVVAVNGTEVSSYRHKEAQEAIIRAGNNFLLTILRSGGGTASSTKQEVTGWRPQVTPVGQMPSAPTTGNQTFTKTSLAANKVMEDSHWDVKHNQTAQGFNKKLPQQKPQNGLSASSNWHIQHQKPQYNSPQALYSEENINDIIEQQSEMLANGVKGINFLNQPSVGKSSGGSGGDPNLSNSETLKMVLDQDEHDTAHHNAHSPGGYLDADAYHEKSLINKDVQSTSFKLLKRALEEDSLLNGIDSEEADAAPPRVSDLSCHKNMTTTQLLAARASTPNRIKDGQENFTSGFRSVEAPVTKPRPEGHHPGPQLNRCAQCDRLITGVFVKVRGQPLHAECFTCSTCNSSLRNVGYFVVNERLYCEVHARLASNSQQSDDSFASVASRHNKSPELDKKNWAQMLDHDKAGAAPNAEEFTKQFMAQMYGHSSQETTPSHRPVSSSTPTKQLDGQETAANVIGHNPMNMSPVPFKKHQTTSVMQKSNCETSVTTAKQPRNVINKANTNNPKEIGYNSDEAFSGKCSTPSICEKCKEEIKRGPFITALGRTWCPGHFTCAQANCGQSLQEVGFIEEQGHLYCEDCFGKYLAPDCEKCKKKILGNCLKAMGKTFHPECFVCAYCGKIFANSPFYLEDDLPYCEEDWNELFTTKCVSCAFPIEAGDRWVEALNNNYHSQCFNCTMCKQNLEGKSFFVKAGKPFCKSHAKMRC